MSDNIYYLYIYLDTRKPGIYIYRDLEFKYEPFYVGISKNKGRCLEHLNESYRLNYKSHKCNKIRKIKRETGNDPIIIKLFENLSKEEAIKLEIYYIKTIGRYDCGNGPLTNRTSGGEGVSGFLYTAEHVSKQSKRMIESWKDDKYRNKQINTRKETFKNNPNKATEISKTLKQTYKDNPELAKNSSKRMLESWKNEDYRNTQIESHKEFYRTNPDAALEQSKKAKQYFIDNPDQIIKQSKIMLKLWKDKDFRNSQIESHKEFYRTNPDAGNDHSIRMKLIHAERPELDINHSNIMINLWKENKIFGNSKTYLVIDPDGNEQIIKNLRKFCRENNLKDSTMRPLGEKPKNGKPKRRWHYKRILD